MIAFFSVSRGGGAVTVDFSTLEDCIAATNQIRTSAVRIVSVDCYSRKPFLEKWTTEDIEAPGEKIKKWKNPDK
jgi:hypothetical protein